MVRVRPFLCSKEGAGEVDRAFVLHRLDKVDTADGIKGIRPIADLGVPYPMLLYERFLGRPFRRPS